MMRWISGAVAACACLAGTGMAAPPSEACRAITDPAQRLACYDGDAPPPAGAQPLSGPVQPRRETVEAKAKAPSSFDSRIVAVTPAGDGLYLLRLADDSAWQTTETGAPPKVGDAVHYRRIFSGTRFMDISGRRPFVIIPAR